MKDSDTKIICLIFPEKLTNKMGWALGVTENSQVLCHTHTRKKSHSFLRGKCASGKGYLVERVGINKVYWKWEVLIDDIVIFHLLFIKDEKTILSLKTASSSLFYVSGQILKFYASISFKSASFSLFPL